MSSTSQLVNPYSVNPDAPTRRGRSVVVGILAGGALVAGAAPVFADDIRATDGDDVLYGTDGPTGSTV